MHLALASRDALTQTLKARGKQPLQFLTVGATGLLVNTAAFALAAIVGNVHYLLAAVFATQVSTTWNFVLIERVVFDDRRSEGVQLRRYLRFSALNHSMLLVRGPLLVIGTVLGLQVLLANLATLLVVFLGRYLVADKLIWKRDAAESSVPVASPRLIRQRVIVPLVDRPWPRTTAAAVFAAVAIPGITLRLWALDKVGFNSDEAVYAGQAASIAADAAKMPYFPVFRAHPLLFQTVLSVPYQFGTSPLVGRLASAAFGLATVWVCYALGKLLYGRRVGGVAALFLAVMPYHVVVTRQVLLDGPMVFFATLSLYLLARFAYERDPLWLYSAGAVLGLTFLAKETSIVLVGGAYIFFAITPVVTTRIRWLLVASAAFVLVISPFPLSIKYSGKSSTGEAFLAWQLFRRPNHTWDFYPTTVPWAIGIAVLLMAAAGLIMLWPGRSWRESLLLCWIAVPLVFFELWPVKGFQYLLPIAPSIAILAARGVVGIPASVLSVGRMNISPRAIRLTLSVVIAATLAVPSWIRINPSSSTDFLAGSGGVVGGREASLWIRDNVPEGAELLAIGPSMANIIQFYAGRKSYGLSVSPNPLHRNPVYEPVPNADLRLRNSEIQYLVWDSFSAGRTQFFSDKLLNFAERYNGRVVHTQTVEVDGVEQPIIVVYEVRP